MRAHLIGERAAREVRHHEHDLVSVVDHLDQANDVRMIEPGEYFGLASDALPGASHVAGAAVQHQVLQRHRTPMGVLGEVDDAHGPAAEALLEHVGHRSGQPTAVPPHQGRGRVRNVSGV